EEGGSEERAAQRNQVRRQPQRPYEQGESGRMGYVESIAAGHQLRRIENLHGARNPAAVDAHDEKEERAGEPGDRVDADETRALRRRPDRGRRQTRLPLRFPPPPISWAGPSSWSHLSPLARGRPTPRGQQTLQGAA